MTPASRQSTSIRFDQFPVLARRSHLGPFRGRPSKEPDFDILDREGSERRLCCRACGHSITSHGHGIEIDGRQVHRRVNPAGFEFEFGCFGQAPGASVVGEATTEHSWFAGYGWSFSICDGCGRHLGWFFDGQSPSFHGLVLNRLEIEENPRS